MTLVLFLFYRRENQNSVNKWSSGALHMCHSYASSGLPSAPDAQNPNPAPSSSSWWVLLNPQDASLRGSSPSPHTGQDGWPPPQPQFWVLTGPIRMPVNTCIKLSCHQHLILSLCWTGHSFSSPGPGPEQVISQYLLDGRKEGGKGMMEGKGKEERKDSQSRQAISNHGYKAPLLR